jgi:alkylhydroperoxidase family enzyme
MSDEVRTALKGFLRPDSEEIPEPLDTLARHPALARAYLTFSRHLLYGSTLPPRVRELVVLRTSVICGSSFEREQHEIIARREGVDDADIARTLDGPAASGWSDGDAALMRAVDGLLNDWTIDDATWATLAETYDVHQLMDLVFTVGGYSSLAMAFNAFRTHS